MWKGEGGKWCQPRSKDRHNDIIYRAWCRMKMRGFEVKWAGKKVLLMVLE